MSIYVTLSYQLIDKLAQPLDYFYGYFDDCEITDQTLGEDNELER